jgi:hypothetical protein
MILYLYPSNTLLASSIDICKNSMSLVLLAQHKNKQNKSFQIREWHASRSNMELNITNNLFINYHVGVITTSFEN